MAPKRPDEVAFLTGQVSGLLRPPGISLLNAGGKFTPDGAVQYWPGNTFLCHIDPRSTAFEAIRELQEAIKQSTFNRFFTFLPPPSFHMTIYQGISPDTKLDCGWPLDLPEGLTRNEVTAIMLKRLDRVTLPTSFKIKVDGLFGGNSLTVSGADNIEEDKLRQTRLILRAATGITCSNLHDFVFHITLAYLIDWLSEKTAREVISFNEGIGGRFQGAIGTIDLGPVEFCNFDTMHHFDLVKTLG